MFNLALYFESKNEFGDAHRFYKLIIKDNPYFIDAYIKLGELARMRGNDKKAIEYNKIALDKHFKKEFKPDSNLTSRIINLMPKPINPLLMLAKINFDCGNEIDALSNLRMILNEYEDKDPYTFVFIGNIYYEIALNYRKIQVKDREKNFNFNLAKALECYYKTIEIDKYNCYAAVGIANVLAEFNLTKYSVETYKIASEKQPENPNPVINEGILLMNDKKHEHAIMHFNKILKKFFKGKNPELEMLIAKNYIDNKEFDKANKILKSLIFRYPENIIYKFNYAFCLRSKSEHILHKTERKVVETEEAIENLEKAVPIFESFITLKREINSNFHSVHKINNRQKRTNFLKTLIFSLFVKIFSISLKTL